MRKKRRGERQVISATVVFTTMLAVIMLVLLSMSHHYRSINSLSEVNRIVRTYLLRMEIKGCLSASETATLLQELQECGMSDVKLSGNFAPEVTEGVYINFGKASFGEEVMLKVEGDFTLTLPEADEKNYFDMQQEVRHVSIEKKGVASQ